MIDKQKLTTILHDAISDYASHAEEKEPAEWLQDYLGRKMPNKTIDYIHSVSTEIISTISLMEEKKADLEKAVQAGVSAENWLVKDINKENEGNGEKAKLAVEFFNGITSAEHSYDESVEPVIIDIENESWNESDWNDYRLKDTLKGVAVEAGKAGMREIVSETFLKASGEGFKNVFEDTNFIVDTLEKGAQLGMKTAVSAGMIIAEEQNIIPPTTLQIIATTAHKTIESMSAIGDVIKGKSTFTDAMVKIKNTAVSTFSGMWKQHKGKAKEEIIEAVGGIFGIKGAIFSGIVNGLTKEKEEESRFKTVVKEIGKSALSFLTKKIELPILGKIKNVLFN